MTTSTWIESAVQSLGLYGILRNAKEYFDTKMLLDPFEKRPNVPPTSIEPVDRDRRQGEVAGRELRCLAEFGARGLDTAQSLVEAMARVETGEHNGLIADQPCASIDRMRIPTLRYEFKRFSSAAHPYIGVQSTWKRGRRFAA